MKSRDIFFIDLVVIAGLAVFSLNQSWTGCTVLIATLILKGFSLYSIRPEKRDEVTVLQEQVKVLQQQVTGFNLKIFGTRKA